MFLEIVDEAAEPGSAAAGVGPDEKIFVEALEDRARRVSGLDRRDARPWPIAGRARHSLRAWFSCRRALRRFRHTKLGNRVS